MTAKSIQIKELKKFIANFDTLQHQYSTPNYALKKLQELEGGKLKTMQKVKNEITNNN